ncbi:MAG TPA: glutathione synthase [Polyangiaceae bacterium]|nr:glutathione synthase [Polyangiaceae bacterium]
MRFLFVMDPVEKMLPDKDTSFAFIRGAEALGHECLHCLPKDLFNEGPTVFASVRTISVSDAAPHTRLGAPNAVALADLDAVFIRKDPPFDGPYGHLTRQLDLVKDRVLVLNDPTAVRNANEKLYAFHFSEFMPKTLVSSDPARLLAFVGSVGGRGVIKPLDGAGGAGVLALSLDDQNARSIVDIMTREGQEMVLVQEYQPAIRAGDKRVLLLDGKSLGAILRVPRKDDLRANIHAGGRVQPTTLSPGEEKLVASVGRRLSVAGLYFVGLDLIGEKLIEVNVTSPTGIQELGRHLGTRPELDVIRWVETTANARRAAAKA